MKNWIGISLGDVTGVGPEVALKAVAAEAGSDDTKYLFIGDEQILTRLNEKFSLNLPLKKFSNYNDNGRFFITNPLAEPLPENLPAGSPFAANAAVACVARWADSAACAANSMRSSPHRSTRNPSSAPATNSSARRNFSPNSPAPNAPR